MKGENMLKKKDSDDAAVASSPILDPAIAGDTAVQNRFPLFYCSPVTSHILTHFGHFPPFPHSRETLLYRTVPGGALLREAFRTIPSDTDGTTTKPFWTSWTFWTFQSRAV